VTLGSTKSIKFLLTKAEQKKGFQGVCKNLWIICELSSLKNIKLSFLAETDFCTLGVQQNFPLFFLFQDEQRID